MPMDAPFRHWIGPPPSQYMRSSEVGRAHWSTPARDIEVYGEISADAKAALDPLGAKYHDHLVGFSRY